MNNKYSNYFDESITDLTSRIEGEFEKIEEVSDDVFAPDISYEYPSDIREWVNPFPQEFNPKDDHSYASLVYLKDLGYTTATWHLSEVHPKHDICDDLDGRVMTVDELVNTAQYNPPSPIFTISHPKCRCYVTCEGPTSPHDIPDSAPGLPLYASPEEILNYKEILFQNLVPLNVDSMTLPPTQPHLSQYFSTRTKFAEEGWSTDIQPIAIYKEFSAMLPLGFSRPIYPGDTGFQLSISNLFSYIFLCELNRTIIAPTECLQILALQPTNTLAEQGIFVATNELGADTVGVITRASEGTEVQAFIPELNSEVTLTNFQKFQ